MPDPTRLATPQTAGTAGAAGGCARCLTEPARSETHNGDAICHHCASRNDTSCPGCGRLHPADWSCLYCVTCRRCGAIIPEQDSVVTTSGSTICATCRGDFYWQCPCCDGWNRNDDELCYSGCCDSDCDCPECRSDRLSSLLYRYDYKPIPVFHGTGPLYLGPEIELEVPYARTEECIGVAQSYLGNLGYLKTDGSLDNGIEIVTHPMSYPWAMANFPWPMLAELSRRGCTVTDNTGLHVHVSRTGFTSACHTYRWMKFIYRNQRQVEMLARRSSSWAAFTDDDRRAVKDYAKGAWSARYRAINTGNPDTFELRIFASSLNPSQVQAVFGFAAASIEYTRQLSAAVIVGQGGWAWPAFVAWLAEHPAYAPLLERLEELRCAC